MRFVLDENRQAIHQQRLRDAIHHRCEHRIEAHFGGERAAELNQRAAIIETVPVKEPVQARLNPVAKRLKQKCGDDDGDDAAHHAGRPGRVEQRADQRDERDIYGHHAAARRRIRQAALEDDVHVHQPVADDGVAETKRDQHQRNRGKVHPRPRHDAQEIRHHVQKQERKNPGERSAGDPFQLLPQDARRRAAIAVHKHNRGEQEINAQAGQIELVEQNPRANRRHEAQLAESDQHTHEEKNSRDAINRGELRALPSGRGPALRKYQSEMQQQRGLQEPRHDAGPVNFPVKGAQLSRILEGIQDEGNQAENIEMHGASGVPAARENKKADEKIEQAHNAQIIFDGGRPLRRLGYQLGLKLFSASLDSVVRLRPQSDAPQALGDVDGAVDRAAR